MKDSYGSAFSIGLFAFFFVVFVCFIAIALKFAQTYRIKNHVINFLEQHEYDGTFDVASADAFASYMNSASYDQTIGEEICKKYEGADFRNGVCIIPVPQNAPEYFRVEVYFGASFPLIGLDKLLIFPISGETKSIVSRP